MQEELITQISTVSDKDTLRKLGEELAYSLKANDDLAGMLSEADLKKMLALAN